MALFGETAQRLAQALHKGDRVYVEGTIKLNSWTGKDGVERTGLSVAAQKAEKLGAIGRNRPPKAKDEEVALPDDLQADDMPPQPRRRPRHARRDEWQAPL